MWKQVNIFFLSIGVCFGIDGVFSLENVNWSVNDRNNMVKKTKRKLS